MTSGYSDQSWGIDPADMSGMEESDDGGSNTGVLSPGDAILHDDPDGRPRKRRGTATSGVLPEPIHVPIPESIAEDVLDDDVADLESSVFFSASHEVATFHWAPFLAQWAYHTLTPISLPVMWYVEGSKAMRNQGFIGLNPFLLFLNYILQIMTILLCIFYFGWVYEPFASSEETRF